MIPRNILSFMISYLSIIFLIGVFFFGAIIAQINFKPTFFKINLDKIKENHTELSLFVCSIFFLLGYFFCNALKKKIDSDDQKKKNDEFINEKIDGKKQSDKEFYLSENLEKEEENNLIHPFDENEYL